MRRRPVGVSSRVRRGKGPRQRWQLPDGRGIDLPVVVDVLEMSQVGEVTWKVEATVDLVDEVPALTCVQVSSKGGLDTARLQTNFRWSTPLDIVTVTIPAVLAMGLDPFTYHFPVTGFPDAAYIGRATPSRLSDEFLTEIAARYLVIGRGYAKVIARERNVSQRTVVSWIEKARARGLLTSTTAGKVGGRLGSPRRPSGVG